MLLSTANGDYVCYENSQCTQLGLPSSAPSESGCCSSVGTTHFINIAAPTECRPCSKCHVLNWLFLYINTLYSGNIRVSISSVNIIIVQICAD